MVIIHKKITTFGYKQVVGSTYLNPPILWLLTIFYFKNITIYNFNFDQKNFLNFIVSWCCGPLKLAKFDHKNEHKLSNQYSHLITLLQKQVILIKKYSKKGPHLDKCQKNHFINLNKSFWPCHAWLGVVFLLPNYLIIWLINLING